MFLLSDFGVFYCSFGLLVVAPPPAASNDGPQGELGKDKERGRRKGGEKQ